MNQELRIFLIIFIVILAGLAVYGYFGATPKAENKTEAQPRIEITPKFFDFGTVEYGTVLKHTFSIKNAGKAILKIKRIATSCACTKGELRNPNSELKPGEEAELVVTYDTGAMSGPHGKGRQERIIFIQSNDPRNPQVEIKITAYVN